MGSIPDPTQWPQTPSVCALVAAWNEAHCIKEHLQSFQSLNYPNKRLILCAGGDDGTFDLACRQAGEGVTVLEQLPGEGKQASLRKCLAECDAEIAYLTDADCIFADGPFLRMIAPVVRGDADVTTGDCEPKVGQRSSLLVQYQWYRSALWVARMPPTVRGLLGGNSAVRVTTMRSVGGYDPKLPFGDDAHLGRRLTNAGHAIRTVPQSRIATEFPDSLGAYLRKKRRLNRGQLIHGVGFRVWKNVALLVIPFVFYTLMFVLPFLVPVLGPVAWALPLAIFAAALAKRLRRLILGARLLGARLSWGNLLTLPFYTLLDIVAVPLAFFDMLLPRLRDRW